MRLREAEGVSQGHPAGESERLGLSDSEALCPGRLGMSLPVIRDGKKAFLGNVSKQPGTRIARPGLCAGFASFSASRGFSRSLISVPRLPRPIPLLAPHSLFICLSISLPRFLISKPASYYRKHNDGYTCLWQYYCLAYCFVKYSGSLGKCKVLCKMKIDSNSK